MHTLALIVALVVGGAPGSSVHSGRGEARSYVLATVPIAGGLVIGDTCSGWPIDDGFRLISMHFTENFNGSVGTSMTYAVRVNGIIACSITVACDSTGRQDAECDDEVQAGDDIEVAVVADGCFTNPSGNLVLRAK